MKSDIWSLVWGGAIHDLCPRSGLRVPKEKKRVRLGSGPRWVLENRVPMVTGSRGGGGLWGPALLLVAVVDIPAWEVAQPEQGHVLQARAQRGGLQEQGGRRAPAGHS